MMKHHAAPSLGLKAKRSTDVVPRLERSRRTDVSAVLGWPPVADAALETMKLSFPEMAVTVGSALAAAIGDEIPGAHAPYGEGSDPRAPTVATARDTPMGISATAMRLLLATLFLCSIKSRVVTAHSRRGNI
jgi:hypothetical protein